MNWLILDPIAQDFIKAWKIVDGTEEYALAVKLLIEVILFYSDANIVTALLCWLRGMFSM